MRGAILCIVLVCWFHGSRGQSPVQWQKFAVSKSDLDSRYDPDKFYLVEADRGSLIRELNKLTIFRSFDRTHHIVRFNFLPNKWTGKVWLADDAWKWDIDSRYPVDQFYIIALSPLSQNDLQQLTLINYFPDNGTYVVEGNITNLESLAENPSVLHVSNKIVSPKEEARVIDMNLNPNRVNKIHHVFPDLNGNTETVSIQENNFDVDDIDILNRNIVSGLESEIIDNHASEMATIIAGAGNSFVTGRGVASQAKITSSDFVDAMPDDNADYLTLKVNVQNHSYGIPLISEYGVQARAFDMSAANNKSLLHVFSSGNEGLEVATDGIYSGIVGFANLTGNIKMTKNSLVVGSVDTVGSTPAFVSRGPAYDGRVKPEVVAYSVVGSSNSAALVSGIATLLYQQFRQMGGGDMPSALAKAFLINGSEDVGPAGLDFVTGYGNVNAWRSLETLRLGQYDSGIVANGSVEQFTLNLPVNAVNLKVTLCWTDIAANVGDFPALINDLDLRLVNGALNTTLPWVLDTTPSEVDLSKSATRGVDRLNNVEQVTIASPDVNYTVEVEGTTVVGSQQFYIVWQYDLEETFEWDYPTGSDNMPYNGETGSYFRWTTTKNGLGQLAYSLDDVNWTVLDDAVDLEKGYWRWNTPPMINNRVKARMTVGTESFETEYFTISEPLSSEVGFNCGDSLLLKWDFSPNATDYTIFSLGNEQLEVYQTVKDTFSIISNTQIFSRPFFSVQPNLPSGEKLLSIPTFDYTLQGIECYVFSFFQTVALDTGIYLNMTLGTSYGIEEIVFQRNELFDFVEIGRVSPHNTENVSFLDDSPNQGYNEHRAILRFINGEELVLAAGTTYYLTDIPIRIFPNPVVSGELLTIITREFGERTPKLELIDNRGALIYTQRVEGSQDQISTDNLRPGIYYYRLIADGKQFYGRIFIR